MSDERRERTSGAALLPRHCVFVYGTLMDDALVAELTGRRFCKAAATLTGYRKEMPSNDYPYVVPDADARVDGFLLYDVDADALRRIDHYEDEGELYRRTEVVVSVGAGREHAWIYLGARAAR
jgi:gamma-glutamylaminecyclotransferase